MTYFRVIPRDLFNEANLLKCIGRLSLLVHDERIPDLKCYYSDPRSGFLINQDPSSGSIYVSNILFTYKNKTLKFVRPLNSRDSYPLYLETLENSYEVFDNDGNFILNLADVPELRVII